MPQGDGVGFPAPEATGRLCFLFFLLLAFQLFLLFHEIAHEFHEIGGASLFVKEDKISFSCLQPKVIVAWSSKL